VYRFTRMTSVRVAAVALAAGVVGACTGDSTDPEVLRLEMHPAVVDLGTDRSGTIEVRNTGTAPMGPVLLAVGSVLDGAGAPVQGVAVTFAPGEIATLNAGQSREVEVTVDPPAGAPDGAYAVALQARVDGDIQATSEVDFEIQTVVPGNLAEVVITGGPANVRQGDLVTFTAEGRDAGGDPIAGVVLQWSVVTAGSGLAAAGGRFVGYAPGTVQVVASLGEFADTVDVNVTVRGLSGSFTVVGQGVQDGRYNSDLWLHPTAAAAYTGTWANRNGNIGNTLYAWDIADPAAPVLTDSLFADAFVINDVKVRSDGNLAVMTHESGSDNGVSLLDLSDPAHPTLITRFGQTLQTGVHNAWIEGDYVYLVVDGISPASGLRVLDISDPMNPVIADEFYAGSSFLHDVYVRDGLALLSHWDAGLVILDVGNGMAGGAPGNVVEVSRIQTAGGQTHNAWYWPAAGYVFVGEEDFASPYGIMHVIDVRNLTAPREVATFRVAGATPHNFWLDEANEILYLSWYENGVRALDVSGDLLGELDRQGREIAGLQYAAAGGGCPSPSATTTCNWAPQLRDGLLYLADMHTGIWVLQPDF